MKTYLQLAAACEARGIPAPSTDEVLRSMRLGSSIDAIALGLGVGASRTSLRDEALRERAAHRLAGRDALRASDPDDADDDDDAEEGEEEEAVPTETKPTDRPTLDPARKKRKGKKSGKKPPAAKPDKPSSTPPRDDPKPDNPPGPDDSPDPESIAALTRKVRRLEREDARTRAAQPGADAIVAKVSRIDNVDARRLRVAEPGTAAAISQAFGFVNDHAMASATMADQRQRERGNDHGLDGDEEPAAILAKLGSYPAGGQ